MTTKLGPNLGKGFMSTRIQGNKWIYSFLAVVSLLITYLCIRLINQLGESFDLEAVIPHFKMTRQVIGIFIGLLSFVIVIKNSKAMKYLVEVYAELVKVIWADRDTVTKITVGLVVALSIVSGFFLIVDVGSRKILELIY